MRPLSKWQLLFEACGLTHLPRTSVKLRGTARNVDNRHNFHAFAGPITPLGLAWDELNVTQRMGLTEGPRRAGSQATRHRSVPTSSPAHASAPVRSSLEVYGRGKSNATHSVPPTMPPTMTRTAKVPQG